MNKGLQTFKSASSVQESVDRMVAQIDQDGWHVFARIDHAKEARDKGLELRPTELLLFGNPKIGTKLMQDRQISAIDLPMKALVWEDAGGQVYVACNEIKWLKRRHDLSDGATLGRIAEVLGRVCAAGYRG